MKVLFIIDKIGGGGRERRMAQLVCELNKHDDVEMMAITSHKEVEYKEIEQTSLTITVVNDSSHFVRLSAYEKIISYFRPNIIHLWSETPMYCLVIPWMANKYGSKYLAGFVADGNPLPSLSFRTLAIRYTFWRADSIVSNSNAGLIAKKTPKNKSRVIKNGFDFKRLMMSKTEDDKRKELGLKSRFIVSMVARVHKAKDWSSFIRVAEMASRDMLDVYFYAVGSGNMIEHYEKEIESRELHNIRFLGRRTDVEEILSITDVSMLFTSDKHQEGISNSIMEAMAAGIPVVATEGGGTQEIITNGLNGFIIPQRDAEKAYELLKMLLSDENTRSRIGSSAKKHIHDHFRLSQMCDEYMSLYRELMNA